MIELKKYEIKEIKLTYKMASLNPKYKDNDNLIIQILADEYNVSTDRIKKIIYRNNEKGTIGSKLRALRKKRHLTQQEVSNAIGISSSTLGGWELNKSFPRRKNLEKLLEFYGITVEEFKRQP
ncbi:helix-turn-helix domain-containing protein [Cytobacillus pseudoceanisediminis]|uniref:helix-turn-helix domain-containing protein n=1 Tax=Cytobacillus pseudoceanisediminis TaxID=3051614 RepID=UPI003658E579